MAAIFINTIPAGTGVAFTDKWGILHEGVAIGSGWTHPVECYTEPAGAPYVTVECGDGSYRLGPIYTKRVFASQLRSVFTVERFDDE
jgi:hypothetical protein